MWLGIIWIRHANHWRGSIRTSAAWINNSVSSTQSKNIRDVHANAELARRISNILMT